MMTTSESNIKLNYRFKFENGKEREFIVELDEKTLDLIPAGERKYPAWAELNQSKCPNCPLDPAQNPYCNVALNMIDLIEFFSDTLSYEPVNVEIKTTERSYSKQTNVQSGLSSLIGIYMPTSGCPILEKMKPMVRFHLPFASETETKYRAMTMYLMAQYLRLKNGKQPEWDLTNLVKIYEDIRIVNRSFCQRLTANTQKDASANAVIILDCFADAVAFTITANDLEELNNHFNAYLK